ncbi:GntR family transcriptional regulator [Lederbergia wuyishanensis]|uniref:DNA-binding LacI/PurR family transcriptional regulator n=1 Tax=Lederbergia wuyishanensis TaxID=1347903 RepID=A0ABU0D9S6_9BACI|nr:GntR family transcriptional regulator [Lederbergia wuyishanensis]MCJ8007475.1 GntR family transcriptional regulator [Lederbergia wuyishanensis]MDQ0345086.1 DNA-binding LacI/PurR family transcriptional regulator [Lederbergia wuyishanensis]
MKVPLYKQIYENILQKIQTGELKHGDKIPSEKELADGFQVSRITSKKALDLLAQEQIIERVQGKGSFVNYLVEETENMLNSIQTLGVKKELTIGLVLPGFSDSYGAKLVQSIENNTSKYGANLLIKLTRDKIEDEEKAIEELVEAGVKGIIIMPIHGEHYNHKILELVLKKFPIILVDRYLRGIQANAVFTDNINASKKATEYLMSLGHQYIAYITPPYDGTTVLEDRMKGYQLAHTEQHKPLNPDYIFTNDGSDLAFINNKKREYEIEIENMRNFILNHPEITAFVACRNAFATILLHVIESLDKKVPEDYSIVCFDGMHSIIGKHPFTHIKQLEDEMGAITVKRLISQINGEENIKTELMNFDLIEGLSTASIKAPVKN